MKSSSDLYYRKHSTCTWIRESHKVTKALIVEFVFVHFHEGMYLPCYNLTQRDMSIAIASCDGRSLEHDNLVCYGSRSKDLIIG